ncbi:MAG: hypothetical protein KDB53_08290, partial [Planctomycetes bacterium]|nr:hypothetical protein [Planctomycetota bacterium]
GILRNEQRRSRLEEHLQLARNRREAFMTSMAEVPPRLVDEVLEPLIRSVGVAEKSSLEVRAEYSSRQLRCPIDGMARRVTASDGQHVLEGEPLLEVQSRSCRDVVVWMADGSGWPEVQRGDLIDLRRNRALGALIESRVVSIGAAIEALPQALWLDPRTPEYGRPILARLAQDDLVPGERLSAEFSRREGK